MDIVITGLRNKFWFNPVEIKGHRLFLAMYAYNYENSFMIKTN